MKTVYAVMVSGGHWEDRWERVYRIVPTEERAKGFVDHMTKEEDLFARLAQEIIEKHEGDECLNDKPFNYIDHKGVERTEYDCSDECMSCKAESLQWEDYKHYNYEAVEMEE